MNGGGLKKSLKSFVTAQRTTAKLQIYLQRRLVNATF